MSPNYFKFFILLCYSIIILSLTWFSPISLTGSNFISEYDKVLHILEYAILGYLFVNILHENQVLLGVIVKTGIFIVLFASFDEFLQSFVPGRFPDILDGVADLFGGLLGAMMRKY